MLTERHQILGKIETSDGVAVTPTGSDAVLVYDPECDDDPSFLDRRPSGSSLSQQFKPPGLKMRRVQFKSDLRGSGAVGTAPEWAKFARASAMREVNLVSLALSTIVTGVASGGQYTVGEIVYQGASLAAATAIGICVTQLRGTSGTILVTPISGTFSNVATKGNTFGASATTAAPTTSGVGFGYRPDSERILSISVASWLPSAPVIGLVGSVLTVLDGSGYVVGAIQVVGAGAGPNWATTIDASLLFGRVDNGDTIGNALVAVGIVNAVPIQTRTPSLTIHSNLDGLLRPVAGARGTFSLDGEAGGNLVFNWNFLGKPETHLASLPVTATGLGATRPPRLFQAFAGLRSDAGFFRLPISRVSLDYGNTVGPRQDVNSAGGSLGTFVTARKPVVSIEFENVNTAFDPIAMLDSGTLVGVGVVLGGDGSGTHAGRTAGNTSVLAVPAGQIIGLRPGNKNGVATWTAEIEAQGIAGDDELVLAAF